jgi:hypothetical protein
LKELKLQNQEALLKEVKDKIQESKSWWGQKSTGAKVAWIGLPIVAVVLVGAGVYYFTSQKSSSKTEDE